jgi:hypothetical protein
MNALLEKRDELNIILKCKKRRANPEPAFQGVPPPPVPQE